MTHSCRLSSTRSYTSTTSALRTLDTRSSIIVRFAQAEPESLRAQMFAEVSSTESERLHQLLKEVDTEADALRVFGTPTHVLEPGGRCTEPARDGRPSYIHLWKTLRYESVSDTAIVDVHVDQYGKATASVCGKYLGKPPKA